MLPTLTLTAPSSSPVLHTITLSGTLSFADGATVPAGTALAVSRTGPAGPALTPVVKTVAGGSFSFTDVPQAAGSYEYMVSYTDSATNTSVSAHYYVTVTKLATTVRLALSSGVVVYQTRITLTATLGVASSGRHVSFYVKPAGAATSKPITTVTTNTKGVATATYVAASNATFSALLVTDAQYAAAVSATPAVLVQGTVTQALAGYYASETYQGTAYRVYHHTATLKDTVTVTPNKHGECTLIQIQILYQGTWRWDVITGCGYLTTGSQVFGNFSLTNATGQRYRIRAEFNPPKTDISNIGNYSGWLYFRVAT
jgi:hypothetical protein